MKKAMIYCFFLGEMVEMQDDEVRCAEEECDVTEDVNEGPSA